MIGVVAAGTSFTSEPQFAGTQLRAHQTGNPTTHALKQSLFSLDVLWMEFKGNNTLQSYPVSCPYTSIRYPDTVARLDTEVSRLRSWMNLKLQLKIPAIMSVLFDGDAVELYERIFSNLIKVC